jgi:hypothetical protein
MNNPDKDELAALKKKVEELEAKVDPPKSTFVPMTDAEWIDRMHQMRERRMNHASNFHPDDLRAMEAACPTSAVKDIVAHGTVPTPGYGHRGQSAAPANVSATPGWQEPRPLGPPEGVRLVDAIAIADEVRQRAELKRKLGEG